MEFCETCDNMLYTKIVEESESKTGCDSEKVKSELIYFCKNCGKEYKTLGKTIKSVYSIDYNLDNIKKHSLINEYTLEDPTLPKAIGIKCPNKECPSKSTSNIVYINYDEKNMKYMYACLDCYKSKIEPHIW
jgi:DNA-directed RNA polymerase subunit M/transcription elongation factor TFIIS